MSSGWLPPCNRVQCHCAASSQLNPHPWIPQSNVQILHETLQFHPHLSCPYLLTFRICLTSNTDDKEEKELIWIERMTTCQVLYVFCKITFAGTNNYVSNPLPKLLLILLQVQDAKACHVHCFGKGGYSRNPGRGEESVLCFGVSAQDFESRGRNKSLRESFSEFQNPRFWASEVRPLKDWAYKWCH